ncbi:MAG: hypothetical protein K2G86_00180 [Prevotella sp.]|nr:hypothetical protein [Prevotella sp.]MDE6355002.1 hypothetical protein [Prevotella sp.]
MTTMQLNAEIYRSLSIIAENESLMKRAAKYLKKLAAQEEDETLMTKEEFFAKIDESLQQAREGKVHEMLPGETLDEFLERVG